MLKTMHYSPNLRSRCGLLALLCLILIAPSGARAQSIVVTLTPSVVEAGSPELISVQASSATKIDGEWLEHKLDFFRGSDGRSWFALAGVDVEAPAGKSGLRLTLHDGKEGRVQVLSQTVEIYAAHYRTSSLTVEPQFVSPGPEALKQIEADQQLKKQVFGVSAAEALWAGDFRAPVAAEPTDSFGTRRTFNGKLASIHKGMDFRAATKTPVKAGNSGVVVLARPLYYEGNCVVIDHGLGLYTISMHLSRIDVKEGQRVATGELLGLSGATGRVTGPHLHWGVRWQGAYLDPAKLLKLNLDAVR
jgi:murein DD-endopeptidase MepM/ murein hydrolase activator NlpD